MELLEYHGTDARPTPAPRAWDPGTGHLCFHVTDAAATARPGRRRRLPSPVRGCGRDPGRAQQGRPCRLPASTPTATTSSCSSDRPSASPPTARSTQEDPDGQARRTCPCCPSSPSAAPGCRPGCGWSAMPSRKASWAPPTSTSRSRTVPSSRCARRRRPATTSSRTARCCAPTSRATSTARSPGLEAIDYERRLGYPGPDQLDAFRAIAPSTCPDGYDMVAEVEHLLTRTEQPFVSALQGPVTQAFRIDPGAGLCRQGQGRLGAGAGHQSGAQGGRGRGRPRSSSSMSQPSGSCPAACRRWSTSPTPASTAWTRPPRCTSASATSAADRPPRTARTRRSRRTSRIFAYDALSLEFANRSMWETELWAEYGGDKILAAGIIDVKARDRRRRRSWPSRIRRLLESCAPEKLWLYRRLRLQPDRASAGRREDALAGAERPARCAPNWVASGRFWAASGSIAPTERRPSRPFSRGVAADRRDPSLTSPSSAYA